MPYQRSLSPAVIINFVRHLWLGRAGHSFRCLHGCDLAYRASLGPDFLYLDHHEKPSKTNRFTVRDELNRLCCAFVFQSKPLIPLFADYENSN